MVQSDKSIHPVVLYEYYLICIFMNIHENLKSMGKSRKKKLKLVWAKCKCMASLATHSGFENGGMPRKVLIS